MKEPLTTASFRGDLEIKKVVEERQT